MRSVCNHHFKILQHAHRIIIRIAHTHTHIRRMRSACNHHSNILQHTHRIIIIIRIKTHIRRYVDICDPFVIITPRFHNTIASSSGSHTHTTLRRRIRSFCDHHSNNILSMTSVCRTKNRAISHHDWTKEVAYVSTQIQAKVDTFIKIISEFV